MVLAFVWLALIVLEFIEGTSEGLNTAGNAIWNLFIIHFALDFVLAPRKLHYLRVHWVTTGSLNRAMGALGASTGRRGFGYVVGLTLLVTTVGAAEMYALERDSAFAVFGYVTATLATSFIGRDAEDSRAELPGRADFLALRKEIEAMRTKLAGRSRDDQDDRASPR